MVIPVADANPRAQMVRGMHQAYWNPDGDAGKLLLTIGGTRSLPTDFLDLAKVAVQQGYSVISVDYPNLISTKECLDTKDPNCFDLFRREIYDGSNVSELVTVDFENSLLRRIQTLLAYLSDQDPRWRRFWDGSEIKWSEVVVLGHSQGAGHAAFISKRHKVHRVIMLAGPIDYWQVDEPATWVKKPGVTPGDRYYALLHVHDSFGFIGQKAVFRALCGCSDSKRLIVTDRQDNDPHMAVKFAQFTEEWIQMLQLESCDQRLLKDNKAKPC